jgi:hypothetical protein
LGWYCTFSHAHQHHNEEIQKDGTRYFCCHPFLC